MIEASQIVKRHGGQLVLRGACMRVAKGEVAVVIGQSGAGKSTFLRCLNGLEGFESGRVVVDGLGFEPTDPNRERILLDVRRRLGMVFQAYNLFPHRTVLENVIEGPVHVLGLRREEAVERATTLLKRVGMGHKLDARPRQLSGGQQQLVAIARGLAMEPRAMLFDEPTGALDPKTTREVLAVMTDLARDGLTMIVVTHSMHFARKAATTVHVFAEGVVVESGPPGPLFDHPRHEATRRLLEEVQAA